MTTSASQAPQDAQPAVVAPGEGELRWYRDQLVNLRLTGDVTGNRVSLVEIDLPAGATTPLHRQPYDDETLYVLEGRLVLHIDGEDHVVEPGGIAYIPRELPHALHAPEPTRALVFGVPPGQERYYRALSVPAPAAELPPPPVDRPHPAAGIAMQQTAFVNGVELLGDAPFGDAQP
jgi:quercetin dioxygenase-like cupin family protein